jgi:hypothetical protein
VDWAARPGRTDTKAAVYGSVIVAALVGALRSEHASAEAMTVSLLATTSVFWLAHVWAGIVDARLRVGRAFPWARVRELALREWPIVEAGFVPAVPLALGWLGALSRGAAADLALVLALAELAGWGLVVGKSESTWRAGLVSAAVTTALGLGVVALEILIH